mmetsp:Transcript_65501/g.129100  ORF Transcript_65501/g.129100 Transcript_65501/m.129100 type:complete len:218 (-) Transcript_65501:165-818(-)
MRARAGNPASSGATRTTPASTAASLVASVSSPVVSSKHSGVGGSEPVQNGGSLSGKMSPAVCSAAPDAHHKICKATEAVNQPNVAAMHGLASLHAVHRDEANGIDELASFSGHAITSQPSKGSAVLASASQTHNQGPRSFSHPMLHNRQVLCAEVAPPKEAVTANPGFVSSPKLLSSPETSLSREPTEQRVVKASSAVGSVAHTLNFSVGSRPLVHH